MTLVKPLVMQKTGADPDISYSAAEVRMLFPALLRSEGILQALSPGLTALRVVQRGAGANFSVDVNAGAAVILGDDVTEQGMYVVRSTATENLTIPAPPGSGSRTHRVVARVKDKLHNGTWTTYEWILEVLVDTGTGTPALPSTAISLATVSVASGQASVQDAHITDLRATALLGPGRPAVVSTDAQRPPNPATSEMVWRSDKGCFEVYNGSAWVEMYVSTGGPAWVTYTPTWTGSGSNPAINNGSITGRYTRIGRTVHFVTEIVMGSTTTYGSGTWSVGLPVTCRTGSPVQVADIRASDVSASEAYQGNCEMGASAVVLAVQGNDADQNALTPTTPFTWANTDILRVYGTYETAS